jgi:phenylacetate-CoA ligase
MPNYAKLGHPTYCTTDMLATQELILEATQAQRLEAALGKYLREVPLYSRAEVDSTASLLEQHRQLPLMTKPDIRQGFPQNFLGAGVDLEDLVDRDIVEREFTSGTSEQRTPLILPKGWWSKQERRTLALNPFITRSNGLVADARRVTISSPSCNNDISYTGTPSCSDRVVGQSQFIALSKYPFLWSESDLARMIEETADWNPVFLDVDPVYGMVFARYCERHGVRFPSLQFILSSYEYLSVTHRAVLQRAFGVPVFNLYGSTETGHLLMEDEAGRLRPSLETAALDLIDTDPRGVGDLVVSTLTNPFMPLLRYRIGDLARAETGPYGTSYELHGRTADAIVNSSGNRITVRDVDQSFVGVAGVAHYQLVQRPDHFQLRLISDRQGPDSEALMSLQDRLENILEAHGGIRLETTDLIIPQGSGKFRLSIPAPPKPHRAQ